jgi:hypothetical protein
MSLEAMTVQASGGGVESPLKKTSTVLDRREPPCDPKPLGIPLDQRREIDAWMRNREVRDSLRQSIPVLDSFRPYNRLLFNPLRIAPRLSSNI